MKVSVECQPDYEKEVIIRCAKPDDEVNRVRVLVENFMVRLKVTKDQKSYLLPLSAIYYFEYVDGKVFAYTKENVYTVARTLESLEEEFESQSFFRCSKSMILNLYYVEHLTSTIGNRMMASLSNGEEIIITRHYVKDLRAILRGNENE